ncbi:MAG TPA: methyltransferase domain-containing protein [Candidatus Competibacteraceae bacterium]|nr:methyltransferase domain-containing protein [Candidatus Competibacteraceae bacterium]
MTNSKKATVLVDRYRQAAMEKKVNTNSYKGLGIHALPGLHEFIAKKAVEYFEPEATLLDIAAGTGAMSLSMQDSGFKVLATDYVPENFKLDSIPFISTDLNEAFSTTLHSRRFQAIIASEIIEHLENPRHFARECFKILEPSGRMILSTPNVENAASKGRWCINSLWDGQSG